MVERIPLHLAERVRLVILDVDGVMTDGGIYIGATASGEAIETKRYEITDGLGIHLLQTSGVQVAIVTGRESESVRLRAVDLGVAECHQDASAAKLPIVTRLLTRLGIGWEEVAFVGDDLADIPVLKRVGLPVAVANAVPEVRALARWVTARRGGNGAIREFSESLLHARRQWAPAVERYLAPREREVE
jgi:3-deoxy-D-manno-octulosonate 8-phosphate phosphatase (KDO 8-P phosphatase)